MCASPPLPLTGRLESELTAKEVDAGFGFGQIVAEGFGKDPGFQIDKAGAKAHRQCAGLLQTSFQYLQECLVVPNDQVGNRIADVLVCISDNVAYFYGTAFRFDTGACRILLWMRHLAG